MSILKPGDLKSDTSENESDVDETDTAPIAASKKTALKSENFDTASAPSDDENDGLSDDAEADDDDDGDDDDDDDDDDDADVDDVSELGLSNNEPGSTELNISMKQNMGYDDSAISPINSDVESDDEEYLQKFDVQDRENYVSTVHPESIIKNHAEINSMLDKPHKTVPFLTKYERTRVLGQRAKQINSGDAPYLEVPYDIIDGYLIAQLELKAKKIPFIICRPIPDGTTEYWRLSDLEII